MTTTTMLGLCPANVGKIVRINGVELSIVGQLTDIRVCAEDFTLSGEVCTLSLEATVGGQRLTLTGKESLEVLASERPSPPTTTVRVTD